MFGLLVYVAHCPTDTIGQWSQRGPPRVVFFSPLPSQNEGAGKLNSSRISDSAWFYFFSNPPPPPLRTVGGFLTNKDLQLNDSSCQTKV